MRDETLFRALLQVWDELPALIGPPWSELGPVIADILAAFRETDDGDRRVVLVADLLTRIRAYPEARRRLRETVKEIEERSPGRERRRGSPGPDAPEPSNPNELQTLLEQLRARAADPLRTAWADANVEEQSRYVNLCVTHQDDQACLPQTMNLATGTRYHLRLDIGMASLQSVIANASQHAFPAQLLPPTQAGHWLEVVVTSDAFSVPNPRHDLFLPVTGASWACSCIPGGGHSCTPDDRRDYLLVPILAPSLPESARLRVAIYYAKNLVQSLVLTAAVASIEELGSGHTARIDYTLSSTFANLDAFAPRELHILTNEDASGTHRIVLNGDGIASITLAEGQIRGAISAARAHLRSISFKENRGLLGKRQSLLDAHNWKSHKAFEADLRQLATLGWLLWDAVLKDRDALVETLRAPGIIQIARVSNSTFVFPWALVYDIPLESNRAYSLCPLLADDRAMEALSTCAVHRCPYEARHERINFVCPFGFWGLKHVIEQPASMPAGRDLPRLIGGQDRQVTMVAARSRAVDSALVDSHFGQLRTIPHLTLVDCETRDTLAQNLANPVELVYFYAHGRRADLPGGMQQTPYLEIGDHEVVAPTDITAWRRGLWPPDHWQHTAPLVFINGCHTAEVLPESLVNFVDGFVAARAAGVIGTEITVNQLLANEAAERFFSHFRQRGATVGESVLRMRLELLAKRNLVGLAYTAYCSTDLSVTGTSALTLPSVS